MTYTITITRQFGSLGRPIAKRLSELLDIEYYDRDIVEETSKNLGIPVSEISDQEESVKNNFFNMIYPLGTQTTAQQDQIFQEQSKIIQGLAAKQSCIIVGKCADHILRDKPNVLSVFVDAYYDDCISKIRSRIYVSEERAKDMKKRTDKYRTAYYKYYTRGENWKDTLNYDMFLNTSRNSTNDCAEIIAKAVELKFGK